MPLPKVAIVGRPNVGKSSILNWLAGKRVAIVDAMAGVTRDRVVYLMHAGDRDFELVDTGGIGIVDSDALEAEIERQIRIGIEEADLILFVVDGRDGVLPLDEDVAARLRPIDKPTLLVVNKCDSPKTDAEVGRFFRLMDAPAVTTSTKGNRHRRELLEEIVRRLPPPGETAPNETAEPLMKLAIVGRRNAGKSTFINALAEAERVIVSETAGTTRDSIDVRFEVDDKPLLAIDTPGVRKRKSIKRDVDYYGLTRAQRSIRRADVVLMVFDASRTISKVDKQLVDEIHRHFKPCIFVINKWDLGLGEEMTTQAWSEYLLREFGLMRHVPVAFVTAKNGRNVKAVVNLAQNLFKQSRMRVGTADLNRVVRAAVEENPPPYRKNRRPKIYYATQVATMPPTIVLKCNDPSLFDESWKRFLRNVFHEELPFEEVPIKLYFRPRQRDETEAPPGREWVAG